MPELLSASERLERDEATAEELRALLRGGSSLGGARPKAHVVAADGRIAIAKFPSAAADEWDVIRWEHVALRLARDAGIRTPVSALHLVDGKPVLVVDRFDRSDARRLGYVSAMTMLEATDGDERSYLDIAEVIEEHSPAAGADLRELWRRVAFSILIRNTDDHLRNHGFLRESTAGWTLSPAFDLPSARPGGRGDPARGHRRDGTLAGLCGRRRARRRRDRSHGARVRARRARAGPPAHRLSAFAARPRGAPLWPDRRMPSVRER